MAQALSTTVSEVTITLMTDADHDTNNLRDRKLVLTRHQSSIVIGRSSKIATKGFVVAKDTAWFDNQVMSRNHAEIYADLDNEKVKIRDVGSMHGTWLNNDQLAEGDFKELKDSDQLRFGIYIIRGVEAFTPTSAKVGIEFGRREVKRVGTPDNTFKVPDGSVFSDDEEVGSAPFQPLHGDASRPIDLSMETSHSVYVPTIIDITSEPSTPEQAMDVAKDNSDGINALDVASCGDDDDDMMSERSLSPDLGEQEQQDAASTFTSMLVSQAETRMDELNGYLATHNTYEDESIHLSSDDDVDTDLNDAESPHTSSSEDEDNDSEEGYPQVDEDDSLEDELESNVGWEAEYMPEEDHISDFKVSAESESEENDSHITTTGWASLGAPFSPQLFRTLDPSSTAGQRLDKLAMGTGKTEFFAAREANKARLAGSMETRAEPAQLPISAKDSQPSQPAHGPFVVKSGIPSSKPTTSTTGKSSGPLPLACSQWCDSGAKFLKTPLATALDITPSNKRGDEEAMTSAHTFRLHKLKTNASQEDAISPTLARARTHVSISDLVDNCQNTFAGKGRKRKAEEMTTAPIYTEDQPAEVSGQQGEPALTALNTPPQLIQPPRPLSSLPTPPETVEIAMKPRSLENFSPVLPELPQIPMSNAFNGPPSQPRSTKKRRLTKIAERVGYAALGGVTVSAMVVGSLIYTAPTF